MPDQHFASVRILQNMVQEGGKDSNPAAFSLFKSFSAIGAKEK
jgi:hypothetical protein